jgi:hypothetical protein
MPTAIEILSDDSDTSTASGSLSDSDCSISIEGIAPAAGTGIGKQHLLRATQRLKAKIRSAKRSDSENDDSSQPDPNKQAHSRALQTSSMVRGSTRTRGSAGKDADAVHHDDKQAQGARSKAAASTDKLTRGRPAAVAKHAEGDAAGADRTDMHKGRSKSRRARSPKPQAAVRGNHRSRSKRPSPRKQESIQNEQAATDDDAEEPVVCPSLDSGDDADDERDQTTRDVAPSKDQQQADATKRAGKRSKHQQQDQQDVAMADISAAHQQAAAGPSRASPDIAAAPAPAQRHPKGSAAAGKLPAFSSLPPLQQATTVLRRRLGSSNSLEGLQMELRPALQRHHDELVSLLGNTVTNGANMSMLVIGEFYSQCWCWSWSCSSSHVGAPAIKGHAQALRLSGAGLHHT